MLNRFGKKLFCCLCTIICWSFAAAQVEGGATVPATVPAPTSTPTIKNKLFTGGSFSLQFGDITYIYLSPILGYRINEVFSAGAGPVYSYLEQSRIYGRHSSNTYGGRVFGQARFMQNYLGYTEFEVVNADVYNEVSGNYRRNNIESLLVGGGYIETFGSSNSGFTLMILFNLLDGPNAYYTNPIVRAGFNIGL